MRSNEGVDVSLPVPGVSRILEFTGRIDEIRAALPPEAWKALCESDAFDAWREVLKQDPYTRRALEKPRGYAGDACVMDLSYGHPAANDALDEATEVGREIYRHTFNGRSSASARLRVEVVANEIRSLVAARGTIAMASFASGHARELERLGEAISGVSRFHVIDRDRLSVEEVVRCYGSLVSLRPVERNVFRLRQGEVEPVDFAYSMGLFDYLDVGLARRVARTMANCVAPGGRLLIGNLTTAAANLAYCECVMDWWMIPRSVEEMEEIGRDLEQVGPWRSKLVAHGCFHYLVADRAEEGERAIPAEAA